MANLTPIRIRGKRTATEEEKWHSRKRRKVRSVPSQSPHADHNAPTSTKSLVRAAAGRSRKRLDPSLSKLEQLPTEVLQDIFQYSANVSLPLVSSRLTSQLASRHLYQELTSTVLGRVLGSGVHIGSKEVANAMRLMNSKFFTWPFFCQWLDREFDRLALLDEWAVEQETEPLGGLPSRDEWTWRKLDSSPALPPPKKLLRAPFTEDSMRFLSMMTTSFRCSPELLDPVYRELAQEGLQQAIETGAEGALDAFWTLGAEPDTEHLRTAVIDAGCDVDIVLKLVNLASRSEQTSEMDFLDPALWAWADRARANGESKGAWLMETLRKGAADSGQEDRGSVLGRGRSVAEESPKAPTKEQPPDQSASTATPDPADSTVTSPETSAKDTAEGTESQPKAASNKRKTMQEFMQKTGAHLRTQSASLRARGSKFSEGMRGSQKSKVVKPPSKRNSQRNSQVNIKYTSDNDVIEKILASQPREKQASAVFLSKQRDKMKVRKPSSSVSPLESQAELDRKPLTTEEVLTMFTGAPYFGVEEREGTFVPQVVFRGGDQVRCARYSTDYEKLDVRSFGACTLGQHRTRQLEGKPAPCLHETESTKEESTLLEVPSMLAASGREPGAIGFEHFLQIPISDSLSTAGQPPVAAKLKLLKADPEQLGLRKLDMEELISRLTELGDLHASEEDEAGGPEEFWNDDKIVEMGEDLFDNVLSVEPGAPGAESGVVSLKDQIIALQKVLDNADIWHDFSVVEWRIWVGQLLWASDDSEQPSERKMLLLQITLASELLVRMQAVDSVPAAHSSSQPVISAEDVEFLEAQRSNKVKWDLLLAERFLGNLTISVQKPTQEDKKMNRSSLWSAITFLTAKEAPDDESSVQPVLSPKDDLKQIDGLVNFAEAIHWPHAKDIRREMEAKLSSDAPGNLPVRFDPRPVSTVGSIYATPLSSPMFPSTPGTRGSFFGLTEQKQRPGFARNTTAQSVQLLPSRNTTGLNAQEVFEVGGWLSRSWLSGLVLPGEPASHFLISTLLEHSSQAITALGAEANLYGGFSYEGRTFWSKSCIVGRVLAATPGSTECMGWISIPEFGDEELEDGWININVEDAPKPAADKPRIEESVTVGRASDPIGGQDATTIQAGDFTTPTDSNPVMGNIAKSHGISFATRASAARADKESSLPMGGFNETEPTDASLVFSNPTDSRMTKVSVPLTYDVNFVSSYPCHPPRPKARMSTKPKTPSPKLSFEQDRPEDIQAVDSARPSKIDSTPNLRASHVEKELPPQPAHPLHIEYHYDVVSVATLLTTPAERRPRTLSSPQEREAVKLTVTADGAMPKPVEGGVTILDCRGVEGLELLARAWCAKVGENALIGKSGRTCLACCIREAKALDIAVVIRT